jgi:hypothetical protein
MARNLICILFLFTLAGCVANRGYQQVEQEGPCPWTQDQRQVAWENALQALWDWDAEYYAYCEEDDAVGNREFEIAGGVCRTYLPCTNTGPNGDVMSDGQLFATFELESRVVIGFSGAARRN